METYHKIQTLFKRDMDGSITGQKGKMIHGEWTTPELEYLAGNQWEFTEKVDGTNIRIGWDYAKGTMRRCVTFAGRGDKAVLPKPLRQYLESHFTTELFESAFPDIYQKEVILFGEGYGPKIQNGGNYRSDQAFVLFDVKIDKWWMRRDSVNDIASRLGIESVPVIGYGTLHDAIDKVSTGLQSRWGNFEAEGIVARPSVPMFNRKGERIITKIKAVDFR